MRKKIFFGTAFMAVVLMFSACTQGGAPADETKRPTASNETQTVAFSDTPFVKNGKSDYIIVVSDWADENEKFAARELQHFIEEATGCRLGVTKEISRDESKPYISVGNTQLAKDEGLVPERESVGTNGFLLKTVNGNMYIAAYHSIGTRNGVYEWLSYMFGYECYATDEIALTHTKNRNVPLFDLTVRPSFDWREANYREILAIDGKDMTGGSRFKMNQTEEIWLFGHDTHNSLQVVSPVPTTTSGKYNLDTFDYRDEKYASWYARDEKGDTLTWAYDHDKSQTVPVQLCYSSDELCEQYTENLIKILQTESASQMLMGMEDNRSWCHCEKCSASKEQYGTDAAAVIKFANKVQRGVNEWYEENEPYTDPVKLVIFAYYATVDPPVVYDSGKGAYAAMDESVRLDSDVGIMFAPIDASYSRPFTDDVNENTKNQVLGWSALTDNLYAWTYSLLCSSSLILHDTFEVMQENYAFLSENGTISVYDQTEHYNDKSSAFGRLKLYVQSKLQWDVSLNMEALIDDWFANYFKEAAADMQRVFNEERQWLVHVYNDLNATGIIQEDLCQAEYWNKGVLDDWLRSIGYAYRSIEKYREEDEALFVRLYDRITLESLQFRYILISCFPEVYTEKELTTMKKEFKTDFERSGVTSYSENYPIDNLWKIWGVQ